jgi:hypothetical protein
METVSEASIMAIAVSVAVSTSEARSGGDHVVDAELLHKKILVSIK